MTGIGRRGCRSAADESKELQPGCSATERLAGHMAAIFAGFRATGRVAVLACPCPSGEGNAGRKVRSAGRRGATRSRS